MITAATPTGTRNVKSCLSGISRGHRLPVEPAALAEEEVAGVDDLLHLAARLGDRLADLAGDELRQRLEVRLDQPAEAGDHLAAHGRGHVGPRVLRLAGGAAGGDERLRSGELDLGDHVVEPGGVA